MREETFADLVHPQFVGGMQVWSQGGTVQDIIDKLQRGDPVKGWEGDPRLAVYIEGDYWSLERLEADGQYRKVARKPLSSPIDDSIIDMLVARDRRRGFDLHRHITEHNDAVTRQREQDAVDELTNETIPRTRYALRKAGIVP